MIVFGQVDVCPRCRRRDRRKLAYGAGIIDTTVGYAQASGWHIVQRWGKGLDAPCNVTCPNCGGKGYVPR